MPLMTDPKTGQNVEISMEEILRSLRSGTASLSQVATNADGTSSSTMLYGNVSDDGLDRSVSIFVDKESFNAFLERKLRKMTGEIETPQSEEPHGEQYEMTVDFTDSALMGVMRATQTELSVDLYTRDERRTTSAHLRNGSKIWKVNADDTIDFTKDDLTGEDKTISLYMLSFLEMRRYLRSSGMLEELKKLGNRGAGVILRASGQADDVRATIVRGRNRPDLPCSVFLLGTQIMRPYLDELFSERMIAQMSLEEKIAAAEEGDPDCMEALGQQYLNGDGVKQDFGQAFYWIQKLAETGNAIGQFNLGLYYAKGCGVERDFEQAAEWMRRAAENGDEDAPACAEQYVEAAALVRKAEAGDPQAQADAAKFFTQIGGSLAQFGPQDDYDTAFYWAQKAAAQENPDGLYCLALCYAHGRGTPQNDVKAVTAYQKAAALGHAPSQWNLAVCCLNGTGCERDEVRGYMWAYLSADQGHALAVDGLTGNRKMLRQLIEEYDVPAADQTLEGTQYEGRIARCESLREGSELSCRIGKDRNGNEALEFFHNGGSVGLLSGWNSAELLALLRLDRISLSAVVTLCIPRSKRGARAKTAVVHVKLVVAERDVAVPTEAGVRFMEEAARSAAENRQTRTERKAAVKTDPFSEDVFGFAFSGQQASAVIHTVQPDGKEIRQSEQATAEGFNFDNLFKRASSVISTVQPETKKKEPED